MPPLLWLFLVCNFVIGTAAFVISGIVPEVAKGLGVSVPAAGQAMTAYALATALVAPLGLMLTSSWRRRSALMLSMGLYAAGNTLCAVAPSLAWLLTGRVLMGVGAFFSAITASIAVTQVPAEKRGKALAFVFLGISLSYVVGVPLGTWGAAHWGWRAPLAGCAVVCFVAIALLWRLLPAQLAAPSASFAGVSSVLRRAAVLQVLLTTALYFTAIFVVFSYVTPVLRALVNVSSEGLSLTLMAFGLSGVLGTVIGGFASDRFGPRRTLSVQLSMLGLTMLALPFTQGHVGAMLGTLMLWGTSGFGMMAAQQSRLTLLSPAQTPLLLSLNTSMLYLGTAAGAALGGLASLHLGFAHLSWAGLPFIACALAILWLAQNSRPADAVSAG